MNNIQDIIDLINSNNNFAIVSHTSPDGDCMGSMLGLYNSLVSYSKCVDVYLDDEIPKRLSFIPGAPNILNSFSPKEYDIIFALDCGDIKRLGSFSESLLASGKVVNIDHHLSNDMYGDVNLVIPDMSSVGEIIYNILAEGNLPINEKVAMCLYVSILSDTGGFKYSNTKPSTLITVSKLLEFNIDHSKIYTKLLSEKTKEQVILSSLVSSNLELYFNEKVALLYVTQDMLTKSNVNENDSGDLVNIARDIDTVEVGILIKEKHPELYKISLRSKDYFDVRCVAETFGGGGHTKAAGCAINGTFEEIKAKLLAEIKGNLL
ncbi:DHH family phosphoesterase [Clostridium cylindrosporum]|uniref:Bifunctional oligoribonuclease and PAP phosphatase NrnA n=1 Tax=Clostridium cylindrosporum DSM 605 TaxID=1121307 RepID=A0A0J8DB50_CLOCY|nr:bifunctional oligoribonuclease/PAP phosphatase NrnA [Clostridium cylindrosporum]KMT23062.1 bifunctional oligoribonuclease and PAP phosphatase NrnA [Clostridium cylindrosporum DSM 605]